jgi:hypothetical protein
MQIEQPEVAERLIECQLTDRDILAKDFFHSYRKKGGRKQGRQDSKCFGRTEQRVLSIQQLLHYGKSR